MSCSICGEAQGPLKTFRDAAGAFIRTLCQTCTHRNYAPSYNPDTYDPVTGLQLEYDTNQPDPSAVRYLQAHPRIPCGVCEGADYQIWAANLQYPADPVLRCRYCAEDSFRGQYEEPIDAAMAAGLGGIPAEVLAASMVLGPGEVRADIPMEQTDPDFLNREQLEEFFAKMKSARLDSLLKTLDKVSDAITIVARAEDLSTLATSPGEYERRPENATVKQLKHVARSCLNEIHKISANTRTEVSNVGDTPITAVSVSNPDALRKETNPLAGIVEDAAKSFS